MKTTILEMEFTTYKTWQKQWVSEHEGTHQQKLSNMKREEKNVNEKSISEQKDNFKWPNKFESLEEGSVGGKRNKYLKKQLTVEFFSNLMKIIYPLMHKVQ